MDRCRFCGNELNDEGVCDFCGDGVFEDIDLDGKNDFL